MQQLAPLGGPLVGREEEMDAFRRAWAGGRKIDRRRAADCRRKSAELAEALGMSRLLEEIAARAT